MGGVLFHVILTSLISVSQVGCGNPEEPSRIFGTTPIFIPPPAPTVATPHEYQFVGLTSQRAFRLQGTCGVTGGSSITILSQLKTLASANCLDGKWSVESLDLRSLPEGMNELVISETNGGSVTRRILKYNRDLSPTFQRVMVGKTPTTVDSVTQKRMVDVEKLRTNIFEYGISYFGYVFGRLGLDRQTFRNGRAEVISRLSGDSRMKINYNLEFALQSAKGDLCIMTADPTQACGPFGNGSRKYCSCILTSDASKRGTDGGQASIYTGSTPLCKNGDNTPREVRYCKVPLTGTNSVSNVGRVKDPYEFTYDNLDHYQTLKAQEAINDLKEVATDMKAYPNLIEHPTVDDAIENRMWAVNLQLPRMKAACTEAKRILPQFKVNLVTYCDKPAIAPSAAQIASMKVVYASFLTRPNEINWSSPQWKVQLMAQYLEDPVIKSCMNEVQIYSMQSLGKAPWMGLWTPQTVTDMKACAGVLTSKGIPVTIGSYASNYYRDVPSIIHNYEMALKVLMSDPARIKGIHFFQTPLTDDQNFMTEIRDYLKESSVEN